MQFDNQNQKKKKNSKKKVEVIDEKKKKLQILNKLYLKHKDHSQKNKRLPSVNPSCQQNRPKISQILTNKIIFQSQRNNLQQNLNSFFNPKFRYNVHSLRQNNNDSFKNKNHNIFYNREQKNRHKIFYFQGKDQFVRKLLLENQWKEVISIKHSGIILRWTTIQYEQGYILKPFQYYNHIKNVKQLTNLLKLHNNIRKNSKCNRFYPKTFNLKEQFEDFQVQFQRTAILNLLKKNVKYILTKISAQQLKKIEEVKLLQFLSRQHFLSNEQRKQFVINVPLALQSLLFYQKDLSHLIQQPYIVQLDQRIKDTLQNMSKLQPPFQQLQEFKFCLEEQKLQKQLRFSKDFLRYQCKNPFFTPSKLLIKILLYYYNLYKKNNKQFQIEGVQNKWIIKV